MYQTMTDQDMVIANHLNLTNNHYPSTSSISSSSTHSSPSSSSIHYFNQSHPYTFHSSLSHLSTMNDQASSSSSTSSTSSPIINDDLMNPMMNDFQNYCSSSNCPSPSLSTTTSVIPTSPMDVLPPMRSYQHHYYHPTQTNHDLSMIDYHHPPSTMYQHVSSSNNSSPSLRHDSISSTSSTISSTSHIYPPIYYSSSSSTTMYSKNHSTSLSFNNNKNNNQIMEMNKKMIFKDDTIESLTGMPQEYQLHVQQYQQQLKTFTSFNHSSLNVIKKRNELKKKNESTIIFDIHRPYQCMTCSKGFARKHDLQRHTRVHTGVKPYFCLCCKKDFARTDALKRHLRIEDNCRNSPAIQYLKNTGKRRYRNL